MIETLKAYWAAAKVYAFAAVVVGLLVFCWWHGHEKFKAGKAAGDAEVTHLKDQYALAYDAANAKGKAEQQAADKAALDEARERAAQSQTQLTILTQRTATAEQTAAKFKAESDDLKKHNPAVRDWAAAPIPDSVRAAGTGGSE